METNYYIESLKDYLKRAKNEIKDFMEYAELSEQFSYSLTVAQKIILNLEDYIDILKYLHIHLVGVYPNPCRNYLHNGNLCGIAP